MGEQGLARKSAFGHQIDGPVRGSQSRGSSVADRRDAHVLGTGQRWNTVFHRIDAHEDDQIVSGSHTGSARQDLDGWQHVSLAAVHFDRRGQALGLRQWAGHQDRQTCEAWNDRGNHGGGR